jgi:hypothetical protein
MYRGAERGEWLLNVSETPQLSDRWSDPAGAGRSAQNTLPEAGRRLVLRGRHRFADYALTFVFEDSLLKARTHAEFPGLQGRLYRAAVIGSGAHAIVTRRLLQKVARVVGWRGPQAGSHS